MSKESNIIIVGCGLSGVIIAERIANNLRKKVIVLEKRDHIGGNCYDFIDKETGIRVNKYGAHLFHTNNEDVWKYINNFDEWIKWEHEVVSSVGNKYVPIPVNIETINKVCDVLIENTKEANVWLENNQVKYDKINNSEEMAKSRIGEMLYNKMIKNYTYKQWNKYPDELDKSVLSRIPVRCNFDSRYFTDKYQALPKNGYTHFFKQILDNPLIEVRLNTDFFTSKYYKDNYTSKNNLEYNSENSQKNYIIIYTGPIDSYYANKGLPKLEYRSIDFHIERFDLKNEDDYYQCNSVINYPGKDIPYTRSIEYKHFLNQKSKKTIIVSETTNDNGEPYYPVPNEKNINLYNKYKKLAEKESDIYFVGRLANYKYFNMDQAIENALNFFDCNKDELLLD